MNLFFINLLSDMRNQRIAVITLSVGQAVNKFIFIAKLQFSYKILNNFTPPSFRPLRTLHYFWFAWD